MLIYDKHVSKQQLEPSGAVRFACMGLADLLTRISTTVTGASKEWHMKA
jgi:hypothetical protein